MTVDGESGYQAERHSRKDSRDSKLRLYVLSWRKFRTLCSCLDVKFFKTGAALRKLPLSVCALLRLHTTIDSFLAILLPEGPPLPD